MSAMGGKRTYYATSFKKVGQWGQTVGADLHGSGIQHSLSLQRSHAFNATTPNTVEMPKANDSFRDQS